MVHSSGFRACKLVAKSTLKRVEDVERDVSAGFLLLRNRRSIEKTVKRLTELFLHGALRLTGLLTFPAHLTNQKSTIWISEQSIGRWRRPEVNWD
jgi:hypothetical protein